MAACHMTSVVKKKQEIGLISAQFSYLLSLIPEVLAYTMQGQSFSLKKCLNLSGNTGIDTHRDNFL